jgi:hypothetical protein
MDEELRLNGDDLAIVDGRRRVEIPAVVQRVVITGVRDGDLEVDGSSAHALVLIRIAECESSGTLRVQGVSLTRLELVEVRCTDILLDGAEVREVIGRRLAAERLVAVEANVVDWRIEDSRIGAVSLSLDGPLASCQWLDCTVASLSISAPAGAVDVSRGELKNIQLRVQAATNIAIRQAAIGRLSIQALSCASLLLVDDVVDERLLLDGTFDEVAIRDGQIGELRIGGTLRELSLENSYFDHIAIRSRGECSVAAQGVTASELAVVVSTIRSCALANCRLGRATFVAGQVGELSCDVVQIAERCDMQFSEPSRLAQITSSALAGGSWWGVDLQGTLMHGTSGLDGITYGSDCVLPTRKGAVELVKGMPRPLAREQASAYEALARGVAASRGPWRGGEAAYVAKSADLAAEPRVGRRLLLRVWGTTSGYGLRPVRVLLLAVVVLTLLGIWVSASSTLSLANSYFLTAQSVLQIDGPLVTGPGRARVALILARAIGPSALLAVVATARRRGV